jgi:hypothetical protein
VSDLDAILGDLIRLLDERGPWHAAARVRVDPDYDIDGPLNWWDLELAAERRHLGDVRAMRQTDTARAAVNAEKRRLRAAVVVDPCAILDEPEDAA